MTTNQRDWEEEKAENIYVKCRDGSESYLLGIAAALREAYEKGRKEQKKIDAKIFESFIRDPYTSDVKTELQNIKQAILSQRDDTKAGL